MCCSSLASGFWPEQQMNFITQVSQRSVYNLVLCGVMWPWVWLYNYHTYRYEGTLFRLWHIMFCRIKSGNPGYLTAFNTADKEVTVSFNKLKRVPEELNVLFKSSNFNISGIKAKLVSWISMYMNCMYLESSMYFQRGDAFPSMSGSKCLCYAHHSLNAKEYRLWKWLNMLFYIFVFITHSFKA
jgi:hypothetical protein